jgi:hypothetical protein
LETACVGFAETKGLQGLAQAAVGTYTVDVNPGKATGITITVLIVESLCGCTGLDTSFVAGRLHCFCVESFCCCSHKFRSLFAVDVSIIWSFLQAVNLVK